MRAEEVIHALALPPDAQVNRRVPKKQLVEFGALTAADKRQINDGIEELLWVAALKPANIGVSVFRDEAREYLEIAVLSAALRSPAKASRVIELIHRAIPYPVLLVTDFAPTVTVSVGHKRWSLGEAGRMVLDDKVSTSILTGSPVDSEFLAALALSAQPRADLHALYQGWLGVITAFAAAQLTGAFTVAETPEATAARRARLEECGRIQREIAALRAAAVKERQLNRRVELNLAIQRLEAERAAAIQRLGPDTP